MNSQNDESEATTEELVRAYMTGIVDGVGSFSVQVGKDDTHSVGYTITVGFIFNRKNEAVVRVLADWLESYEIHPSIRVNRSDSLRLEIMDREYLKKFLKLIRPFSRVKAEDVEILLEEVLPRLDAKEHTTKGGLIEFMGYVESMPSINMKRRKYTQDYFIQEFEDSGTTDASE